VIAVLLAATSACTMSPPRASFELPAAGIVWLDGDGPSGPCPAGPEPVTRGGLQVSADGPEGSGRYWTVTVSHGRRGVCFTASTVAWRTLQKFDGPLPWIDDTDEDGAPELVVWDSFSLDETESPAAQGLTAWAYEWDAGSSSLRLDLALSRGWAQRLADAYAEPLPGVAFRDVARRQLLDLASGRCTVELPPP
jgi:hypothetical protein